MANAGGEGFAAMRTTPGLARRVIVRKLYDCLEINPSNPNKQLFFLIGIKLA
jgi:hypothetical protein